MQRSTYVKPSLNGFSNASNFKAMSEDDVGKARLKRRRSNRKTGMLKGQGRNFVGYLTRCGS